MAGLISPGVSVSVIDNSYYGVGEATTIPLFFIATADEKTQSGGILNAIGTYESGIVRTVTSITQSLDLYGIPTFYTDANGNPMHGDSRNEYGLEALNKYLEVGNLAYVIRANVNLNDNITNIKTLWNNNTKIAGNTLSGLIQSYIETYNAQNNLLPIDTGYKVTITTTELESLVTEATVDLFSLYSFKSDQFINAFINDHTTSQAGYQDVLFDATGGFISSTDVTGYTSTSTYGADIQITSATGTSIIPVSILGNVAVTYGALIVALNTALGVSGTAILLNGRIRITSSLLGVTSAVLITLDGTSGTLPLFGSLNLYKNIASSVPGVGSGALNTYDPTYTTIIGTYNGLDNIITSWTTGSVVPTEFTAIEGEGIFISATAQYETTKEFKQYSSLGANNAARRVAIVTRLKEIINDPSTGIRSDVYKFNVASCVGYHECGNELVTLSQSLRSEVFIVGSTPIDKNATGPNGISSWATSTERVNSKLISYAYPHGLTSNIDGATIVSESASAIVRSFGYNDLVGELWFAPAGTTRGVCPQLNDIGYVSGTLGTATQFTEQLMDDGTRSALYINPVSINPIAYIAERGIIIMGEKTSDPNTNTEDRINAERLVMYIRRVVRNAMFPYLFQPNDKITWQNAKYRVDAILTPLVKRRGLYDFLTVVDSTNNTPTQIDAHELYVGIYLKVSKDIEFIYVPISLISTGTKL